MRKPEPWYWAARKGWYVQVGKRQVRLGEDRREWGAEKPKPPLEALREYYRVMASAGLVGAADRAKATVAEVCEAYLGTKEGARSKTLRNASYHLRRLAGPLMGRALAAVRKEDVVRIAESNPRWSTGTKHDFVSQCLSLFGWARDAGYLDFNPFAGWSNPYPQSARTRGMTEEEFAALFDAARDLNFKQVLMFLRGTGCRPGEMRVVEARHVHPDQPLVTLEPALHKTGRRTGRSRVLVMPADVEVMVRALARRHPKGPLFRNSRNGGGWASGTINARVRKYRKKLGLADDVVPYLIRHATLTRLLSGGTDAHLVAKIAGHAGTTTLQTTYYHPDVEKMVAASNKAHERPKR